MFGFIPLIGTIIWKGEGLSVEVQKLSGLTVIRPGVQSMVQDLGRFGYATQGLSQGGPMDLQAYCWVNQLLGNAMRCPVLEVAIGMAEFRAESDLLLAIAGAEMLACVDGVQVGNWCTFAIQQGQTLSLGAARDGMRAYLAVQGGFQVTPILGSVSTVVRNQLGGLTGSNGSALAEGDFLPANGSDSKLHCHVPSRFMAVYKEAIELRVIESYQAASFAAADLKQFYQSEYIVTQDSDRMGVRLEGNAVMSPEEGMVSEGIALGSIQIPPDGQPIILLNDRQTLGGYPKLGCVARVDLPQLAQARPGTNIRFSPISIEQARQEWREFGAYFSL